MTTPLRWRKLANTAADSSGVWGSPARMRPSSSFEIRWPAFEQAGYPVVPPGFRNMRRPPVSGLPPTHVQFTRLAAITAVRRARGRAMYRRAPALTSNRNQGTR